MLLSEPLVLFAALCFIGVAIGGITAFVIFWPLSLVHLSDRHPAARAALGEHAFLGKAALCWLITGRYREVADTQFTGLATPARISALVIVFALLMSLILWTWALVLK